MAKVWIDSETQVEVADYPGMRAVHLTIDGKNVRALPGQTIPRQLNHTGLADFARWK